MLPVLDDHTIRTNLSLPQVAHWLMQAALPLLQHPSYVVWDTCLPGLITVPLIIFTVSHICAERSSVALVWPLLFDCVALLQLRFHSPGEAADHETAAAANAVRFPHFQRCVLYFF